MKKSIIIIILPLIFSITSIIISYISSRNLYAVQNIIQNNVNQITKEIDKTNNIIYQLHKEEINTKSSPEEKKFFQKHPIEVEIGNKDIKAGIEF